MLQRLLKTNDEQLAAARDQIKQVRSVNRHLENTVTKQKSVLDNAEGEIARHKKTISDLRAENDKHIANLQIERHQRRLSEGEIEVLKTQLKDLLAWRNVELERMLAEATIHAARRGRAIHGDDADPAIG